MEKDKRTALVFLILGISFNTIAITNQHERLKISFFSLAAVFFIMAIIKFIKVKKAKNSVNKHGQ